MIDTSVCPTVCELLYHHCQYLFAITDNVMSSSIVLNGHNIAFLYIPMQNIEMAAIPSRQLQKDGRICIPNAKTMHDIISISHMHSIFEM